MRRAFSAGMLAARAVLILGLALSAGCGSLFSECPEPGEMELTEEVSCAGQSLGLCEDGDGMQLCGQPVAFELKVDREARTVTRSYETPDGKRVVETWAMKE